MTQEITKIANANTPSNISKRLLSSSAIFAASFLLLGALQPAQAASQFEGTLKSVSITDAANTNAAPAAVITYTQNGNDFTFNAGQSTDADGSIVQYAWDFGDGKKAEGKNVSHTVNTDSTQVTLTVKDNEGAVMLSQVTVSTVTEPDQGSGAFVKKVNFQPASVQVPAGYDIDSGSNYSNSAGFGWNKKPSSWSFVDRDKSNSPDQAHDTVAILNSDTGVWEMAVANGTYNVTICMGDPAAPAGVIDTQAEGVSVTKGALSSSKPWIKETKNVTVSDGKLTVTFAGSGSKRRLNFIEVEQQ